MPKYFWIFIFLFLFSSTGFAIVEENHVHFFNPPELKDGMVLNVEDCVSLAFKNSPKIKRKKYELDIAQGNVKLAQSKYFPILSAGVAFNYERNSNSIYYDKKYRDLPNVSAMISKMIWDFGKTTALIKMEKFYKIAAEYEFMDTLCHTLFDIKAKYYTLLKTLALKDIAYENLKLNEQFKQIAHPGIDSSTADVYLASADSKYINAQNEADIAKTNLNNSMYLDGNTNYNIKNTETFNLASKKEFTPLNFPFSRENAVEIAYKNSPDLAVLSNTKSAMEQSLKYIKKQNLPELSADTGYGFNNTNFTKNNSFHVGLNLSSDVNLMELKYDIQNAKSELNIADNEISLFKKDLKYEVLRALLNIDCFEKQLPKIYIEISSAKNSLESAFKQYKNNNLDYTALHDSIEDYISAQEKYISCLYSYNMSLIQTEMAMHYHLVDIHHKAEHAMEHHSSELIEHLNEALDCDKKENKTKKRRKNK